MPPQCKKQRWIIFLLVHWLFTTIQWQIIIVANLEKWWILACPVQFYFGLFFGNFSNFSTYILLSIFLGWSSCLAFLHMWSRRVRRGAFMRGFSSFLFFLADQNHKFLAPPSQAQWQRAGMTFTCTPLGLEPRPLLEVPGSQRGAILLSHHPWDAFLRCLALIRDGLWNFVN